MTTIELPKGLDPGHDEWTVIGGRVVDLRGFADAHPGGKDLLRLAQKRDSTGMVASSHPHGTYDKVKAIVAKRTLNFVDPSRKELQEKVLFPGCESAFYTELRKRVAEHIAKPGNRMRGGMIMKSLFILAVWAASYFACLETALIAGGMSDPLTYVSLALAFCYGYFTDQLGLSIQHDANHGAFHESAAVNRIFGWTNDLIGASALIWRHQHTVGHHVHCNDVETDDDTKTGVPMFRFNPELPYFSHMRFQHLYAPVFYALFGMISPFVDAMDYINGHHGDVGLHERSWVDAIAFWGLKGVYALIWYVYPASVLGVSFLWRFFLPAQLFGSFLLALFFAVSHNNDRCEYNVSMDDWAAMQVRTSANWSSPSYGWNWAVGGLNMQIEHHLFPCMASRNYPAISPIVRKCCEDFNLPYNGYDSFTEIVISHFSRMYKLGRPPKVTTHMKTM